MQKMRRTARELFNPLVYQPPMKRYRKLAPVVAGSFWLLFLTGAVLLYIRG